MLLSLMAHVYANSDIFLKIQSFLLQNQQICSDNWHNTDATSDFSELELRTMYYLYNY